MVAGGLLVSHVEHSHPRFAKGQHAAVAATNAVPQTNGVSQPRPPPHLPEVLSKQFLQRLDEGLHLAPDQRDAIQKIITDGQNQMRKVIQDARLEIREVLTPEQRRQFDEMVKRPPHKAVNGTNAPGLSPANAP